MVEMAHLVQFGLLGVRKRARFASVQQFAHASLSLLRRVEFHNFLRPRSACHERYNLAPKTVGARPAAVQPES